jgi:hypothetical protein
MSNYVKIVDGGIVKVGRPKAGERRIDTGEWITPLNGVWSPDDLAATGWVEVVRLEKPEYDVNSQSIRRGIPVVQRDGSVVEGWEVEDIPAEKAALNVRANARAEELDSSDPSLLVKAASSVELTAEETRELIRLVAIARLQAVDV